MRVKLSPLPRAGIKCKFLGSRTIDQVVKCLECGEHKTVGVFDCSKFGKCTVTRKGEGVAACCKTCNAYEPSTEQLIEISNKRRIADAPKSTVTNNP